MLAAHRVRQRHPHSADTMVRGEFEIDQFRAFQRRDYVGHRARHLRHAQQQPRFANSPLTFDIHHPALFRL